ncbi:hypothetical protein BDQ17DRAFT_1344969 [Cyathus striatus]|nr:hypothetical protein BDQ17DRAFT_1344969 [Cyathus striatus]
MAASIRSHSFHSSLRLSEAKKNPDRIPPPPYRHAAPSAPWPWVDLEDEVDPTQLETEAPPVPEKCNHKSECCNNCWMGYPQSRFPNWTERQVKKSKIYDAIHNYRKELDCKCYQVDVDINGRFTNSDEIEFQEGLEAESWNNIVYTVRPNNLRVRALFVENMSGPILQMLGAYFNIEPFFFSASLNWIPSRFQEEIQPHEGDHITVTLPFIRSISDEYDAQMMSLARLPDNASYSSTKPATFLGSQKIDTQAPLVLYSNHRVLVPDLLSVHLVRNVNGSTIISFHPSLNLPTTQAHYLHERIRFAGQSVYWQSIFQRSPDPTFVLLTFIWHAMYAWDEALESLYNHICSLETRVITTAEMPLTRELHVIRAHHLHYVSMLEDFRKSVLFIRNTPNPAMDSQPEDVKSMSKMLLDRECDNLSSEVERLTMELRMQDRRLKNVMNLVFSSVNIRDSKYMREMTEAAVRDSAGMKQIAYLTMVFLPASFVAGVFGMNVGEIAPGTHGTLGHYVETAISLTVATIWIIIAFQSAYIFEDEKISFWKRLGWPIFLIKKRYFKKKEEPEECKDEFDEMTNADRFSCAKGSNSFDR